MLLLLQIILCCLLYLALVKCAVRDSGRNCLYFYPDAYLDEAQKRGIADKTEELRKGKRFMTFFCLVIFVVLIAVIAGLMIIPVVYMFAVKTGVTPELVAAHGGDAALVTSAHGP